MPKKTHHFHLSVCHGWLILPLGGCHGYGDGDFGCGAEVVPPHLTVRQDKNGQYSLMRWFSVLKNKKNKINRSASLTQSILVGACLAIRLSSSIHHAGLLVVAAAAGTSAAVSHAFVEFCVSQLTLTLQQGVWVAVWVPQHCIALHSY